MMCKHCKNKATRHFDHSHWLCDRCFSKVIENRIRRGIKDLEIKAGDKVHPADEMAKYVVNRFIRFPLLILDEKRKGCVEILSSCIEEEIVKWLDYFFHNKKIKKTKARKLFTDVSYDDINYYSKLQKIKFRKDLKGKTFDFLEKISSEHPGIKNSFMKAVRELQRVMHLDFLIAS